MKWLEKIYYLKKKVLWIIDHHFIRVILNEGQRKRKFSNCDVKIWFVSTITFDYCYWWSHTYAKWEQENTQVQPYLVLLPFCLSSRKWKNFLDVLIEYYTVRIIYEMMKKNVFQNCRKRWCRTKTNHILPG